MRKIGAMNKHRRKHTAEFKARIALEASKGPNMINEIVAKYEAHPVQVGSWKKELLERVPELFERRNAGKGRNSRNVATGRSFMGSVVDLNESFLQSLRNFNQIR